jgi:alkylated DNA repair dioxygenase AlkB
VRTGWRALGYALAVSFVQASLLGREEPSFDDRFARIARHELSHGAWYDYQEGFIRGHETLFEIFATTTSFRTVQEKMYDRTVDVPRVVASLPGDGPGHPIVARIQKALAARYGEQFPRVSMAMYRGGRDSVAWHGDRVARQMNTALVATVSLGEPRKFLLRPYGGGASIGLTLGWGDLLVMGGTCQRTWQHSVPKTSHAGPRIALMFRPTWEVPDGVSDY